MEFRKKPDYADTAYREAVSRLRILLAESYVPVKRPLRELDSAGEETDNQSVISAGSRTSRIGHGHYHSPLVPRRFNYYTTPTRSTINVSPEKPLLEPHSKWESGGGTTAPPELMSFVERQEEYIEQLEKESRFCRDELSNLLGKVKDVISENENLHEKQKANLIKSVFDHLETETETEETEIEVGRNLSKSPRHTRKPTRVLEGPTIVFESRISELEAQLTQTKIDLKKAQDENETYRRKMADGVFGDGMDSVKKQIESLQREKAVLQDTVDKLQSALSVLRDKENNTCDQVKRSLDVAEQAQYEKTAAELEIRRLKDELERQHGKLRDAISEQSRRVADERSAVERRYSQQIEQLTAELGVQWEQTNKFQLELDKQRRENADLRREIAQKQAQIDDLKKDMQSKITSLQSDIGMNGAEKSSLEQQIATLQLANERQERQARQETSRQHAEMQSLRQRLDRADADLIHSRRENIRLNEQIAALEKELKMNEALADERSKRSSGSEIIALPPPKQESREKEMTSMIKDMEAKHDEGRPLTTNSPGPAPIQSSPVRKEPARAPPKELSRTSSNASVKPTPPQKIDPPIETTRKQEIPPNQQYSEDVNYASDPNQEYRGEAYDQQYPEDPNAQQYPEDPNAQQYPEDPNAQQYSDQPYEEQYMTEEEYQQQYGQYDDPNAQYNQQQYPAEAYQADPQYTSDPSYTTNQYPDNQQYSTTSQQPYGPPPTQPETQQYAASPQQQQQSSTAQQPRQQAANAAQDQKANEKEKTVEKVSPKQPPGDAPKN